MRLKGLRPTMKGMLCRNRCQSFTFTPIRASAGARNGPTVAKSGHPILVMPYLCPVCGFKDLQECPRSVAEGGSYEICPSCGFQFEVSDDDDGFTYESWRRNISEDAFKMNCGRCCANTEIQMGTQFDLLNMPPPVAEARRFPTRSQSWEPAGSQRTQDVETPAVT